MSSGCSLKLVLMESCFLFFLCSQPSDLEKAQLGLGHRYSRAKVKFNVNRVDNMVIQAIFLLDTLDKDINSFSMRVRCVLFLFLCIGVSTSMQYRQYTEVTVLFIVLEISVKKWASIDRQVAEYR